jgi:hypothetical protein
MRPMPGDPEKTVLGRNGVAERPSYPLVATTASARTMPTSQTRSTPSTLELRSMRR